MKRLNPNTNLPFEYAAKRADGFLFIGYTKKKSASGFFIELWVSPEAFKRRSDRAVERSAEWRKENGDRHRAAVSKWAKNNPHKENAKAAKRRSAKLNRTPPWLSKEQLQEIENVYAQAKSISNETGVVHHVDHIVPLQGRNVSGLHVPWNLQILTATENCSKSNKATE